MTDLQIIVEVSKLCNLRCRYCFEYRELGNTRRIELCSIESMFENVRSYSKYHDLNEIYFNWLGGEPMLLGLEYFKAIQILERSIFGNDHRIKNGIQTNLTLLKDEHIEFFRNGHFFSDISVSVDPFGSERVDRKGKIRTELVMANGQRLLDNDIPFGTVTVLCRDTLAKVRETYRFFDELGIDSRIQPINRSSYERQFDEHHVSSTEICNAFLNVLDEFLRSSNATRVEPLREYIGIARNYIVGEKNDRYVKDTDESIFIVNVDGMTFGISEAYDPAFAYGNIFREGFDALVNSASRHKALRRCDIRMAQFCQTCPYFGACPGYFVGDATREEYRIASEDGCIVRHTLDGIVQRLQELPITSLQRGATSTETSRAAHQIQ